MRRLSALALLLVASPAAAQDAWYDASDLVGSLRAPEQRTVVAQAQVGSASELPLYELSIVLADDLRSFELDETIWITNRAGRPLGEIVLRVFANAVGDAPLLTLVRGACEGGLTCAVETTSPSAIVVRPDRAIPPGGRARVRLALRARLREIEAERASMLGQSLESLGALSGAHGDGDYGLLAYSDGVASMSYFFPMLARMRGGRWEQSDSSTMGDLGNDELAHVRARVRVPSGARVAASGTVSAGSSANEHVVTAGFVRDFALAVSPRFQSRERRVGDVTVRSWFVDGDAPAGERVLDAAARAMALFVRRFGPYPYPELDVVEAPLVGGAGGMELSGLVTVAMMFYRPMRASDLGPLGGLLGGGGLEAHRLASLEVVTAHEVAHQWWHGVVGSDSRRHPFQDECLAQYSAMLYLEERHGAERGRREADRHVAASYHMMRMLGRADGAVDRPVSAFGDSMSYAGLVYGKGPYLYRALRSLLGDRAFFAAVRDYVREHRFRVAPSRALFDRMARGPHAAQVRALERRWLEETHGDDDLGQPDLGRMLGGDADDPATRALREMLGGGQDPEQALRGLMRMLEQSGAP